MLAASRDIGGCRTRPGERLICELSLQEGELGVLAPAELPLNASPRRSPVSSDDRTDLRGNAARFADGAACELHGTLHQRAITLRVGLVSHVMKVRPLAWGAAPKESSTSSSSETRISLSPCW